MKDYSNIIIGALKHSPRVEGFEIMVPKEDLYNYLLKIAESENLKGELCLEWFHHYIDDEAEEYYELYINIPFNISKHDLKISFDTDFYFELTDSQYQTIFASGHKEDLEKITSHDLPDFYQVLKELDDCQKQKIENLKKVVKATFDTALNLKSQEYFSIC